MSELGFFVDLRGRARSKSAHMAKKVMYLIGGIVIPPGLGSFVDPSNGIRMALDSYRTDFGEFE